MLMYIEYLKPIHNMCEQHIPDKKETHTVCVFLSEAFNNKNNDSQMNFSTKLYYLSTSIGSEQ